MGLLFTGEVDGAVIVVPVSSAETVQHCERLGLHAVLSGTVFDRSAYRYRRGALLQDSTPTGITQWYEKRDLHRLARTRVRREREHRDADERRRRELVWQATDATHRSRRRCKRDDQTQEATRAGPTPATQESDPLRARTRLVAYHARARRACRCVSCVGVDRVESVVELADQLSWYRDQPFPLQATTAIWRVLDQFVSAAVNELNTKATLPQETVEKVCTQLHTTALQQIDEVCVPDDVDRSFSLREQVEQELDKLRHFVVRWNESKSVRFTSRGSAALQCGIPGDAVVVAVDDTELRRYLNGGLAEQHALFGRHKCVFMKRLSEAAQHSVHELFQYCGRRYDAIAERATPKLSGSSGTVCKFEIEHTTTVRASAPRSAYRLHASETELNFALLQRNAHKVQDESAWGWSVGASAGVDVSVGGALGSTVTNTWQQASAMAGSTRGCCIVVDMTVRHETRAWLSAHAISAMVTGGKAKDANHEANFACEIPLQLTLHVPVHSIVSAWVTNPVSDLLSLLLGDPLVRLISDGRALHIGHAVGTSYNVLTDQKSAAVSDYNMSEEWGAAFLIHPQDDAFSISLVQRTPSEQDATEVKLSTALWVGLGIGGRLVLSEARESFSLHRDSYRYKHWALRAHSCNAFVVRRSDGCLYAVATEPDQASEFVFARTYCPPKRSIAPVAPGAKQVVGENT